MFRICAWCGRLLGFKNPFLALRATHGICRKCEKLMTEKVEKKIFTRCPRCKRQITEAEAMATRWCFVCDKIDGERYQ